MSDSYFGRHFGVLPVIFRSDTMRQSIYHVLKPLYTKFHIFRIRTTMGQLIFTFFKILTCLLGSNHALPNVHTI